MSFWSLFRKRVVIHKLIHYDLEGYALVECNDFTQKRCYSGSWDLVNCAKCREKK